MRAVFIDESELRDDYCLGALVVDDAALRYIERDFNALGAMVANAVDEFTPDTEIHAYEVFHGEGHWTAVPVPLRVKVCDVGAKIIRNSGAKFFFRGTNRPCLEARYTQPHPIHELTLAHLLEDIDGRLGAGGSLGNLGICHADDHHTAADGRRNLSRFKLEAVPGYNKRKIQNIGDTIYFGPSDSSRLLQAADLATYFLNRDRNITESDVRAKKAMSRIAETIRSCTLHEYVWCPD